MNKKIVKKEENGKMKNIKNKLSNILKFTFLMLAFSTLSNNDVLIPRMMKDSETYKKNNVSYKKNNISYRRKNILNEKESLINKINTYNLRVGYYNRLKQLISSSKKYICFLQIDLEQLYRLLNMYENSKDKEKTKKIILNIPGDKEKTKKIKLNIPGDKERIRKKINKLEKKIRGYESDLEKSRETLKELYDELLYRRDDIEKRRDNLNNLGIDLKNLRKEAEKKIPVFIDLCETNKELFKNLNGKMKRLNSKLEKENTVYFLQKKIYINDSLKSCERFYYLKISELKNIYSICEKLKNNKNIESYILPFIEAINPVLVEFNEKLEAINKTFEIFETWVTEGKTPMGFLNSYYKNTLSRDLDICNKLAARLNFYAKQLETCQNAKQLKN